MTTLTKEEIIKRTDEDELYALFHTFIWRLNEKVSLSEQWVILDKEISELINEMKRDYK
jgi:hypothetical protein